MENLEQDFLPLSDFKRKTVEFVKQMKQTKRPVMLTINGKAQLVVQDAESYQQVLDRLDRLEAVEAIRAGVTAAQEGNVKPAREALNRLGVKLGIFR